MSGLVGAALDPIRKADVEVGFGRTLLSSLEAGSAVQPTQPPHPLLGLGMEMGPSSGTSGSLDLPEETSGFHRSTTMGIADIDDIRSLATPMSASVRVLSYDSTVISELKYCRFVREIYKTNTSNTKHFWI